MRPSVILLFVLGVLAGSWPFSASAQKAGGILRLINQENPPSLSILENATASTQTPAMPQMNNAVVFDPLRARETFDTIVPDLAKSWSWSADGRELTLTLHEGVTWHDGKPFTAADVKYTIDLMRGVLPVRLKLNPRKAWYENVAEIVTQGDRQVTFRLKRPQPSLLAMLAAGYTPIYPAHVELAQMRSAPVGTGPFRMERFLRDREIVLMRNKDYFVKGRPYLDGVHIAIISNRSTRISALQAGQADVSAIYDVNDLVKKTLAEAVPGMVFDFNQTSGNQNLLINAKRKPFDDARVRRALALSLDREGLVRSVYQGFAVAGGGSLLPPPWGVWGLPPAMVKQVPGRGDPVQDKEQARALLREAGYGPDRPLRVTVSTRALSLYVDTAVWAIGEMKKVAIEGELDQVDSAGWFSRLSRRQFTLAINGTTLGVDDPDVNFFENFTCASMRNFSDYCNPAVEQRFVEQSIERDPARRLPLVNEIDLQLQLEGARPILAHGPFYTAHWPRVKNFFRHQVVMNFHRLQDVWLDQ